MFTVETNETKSFFSHSVYKINEVSILLSNQSPNDGNQMNRLASLFNFNIENIIEDGTLKPKYILEYILEIFPSYSGLIQLRSYSRDILISGTYDLTFFLYDGKFKSDNTKSLELKDPTAEWDPLEDSNNDNYYSEADLALKNEMNKQKSLLQKIIDFFKKNN